MTFGQLVVGPPGSGKSTFCNGMQQYLTALGRKVAVINLDPANDALPYEHAVNIMDLISLEEVMKETGLGPNGGTSLCCLLINNAFHSGYERSDLLIVRSIHENKCLMIIQNPGPITQVSAYLQVEFAWLLLN